MSINIKQILQDRFSAPLQENYKRRIIFWQDPDVQFASQVDELCPDGVKLLKLTGKNNFIAKQLLCELDTESDYLVYNPISYDNDRSDDWLIDIELYSEEFRADLLSIQMQDLNMVDNSSLRKAMKAYSKFFENKDRVAKLSSFGSSYNSTSQLHIDILAVLSGTTENTYSGIIKAILMDGFDVENNNSISNIRKFGNEEALWKLIELYTGFIYEQEGSLINLASHILLTALSVTMNWDNLKGFEKLISTQYQQNCYDLVTEWMHSDSDDELYEIAREVEAHLGLVKRFDSLEVSDLVSSECFPCINECILRKYMTEISDNVIKADDIVLTVEKRRTLKWYKRVRYYFEGLLQVALMQQFYQTNKNSFHIAEHKKLWQEYCDNFYKMDSYYRHFHSSFSRSLKESSTVLEDLYKNVADYVENLYKTWYLDELSSQWTGIVKDELSNNAKLKDITNQDEFYNEYVNPIVETGHRVYVIISDAFRYEVAADLVDDLLKETKGTAKLSSMQATFPSVTKVGMAALLPHNELQLTDDMKICCDGKSTEGTANREKILQEVCPQNVAITYKSLLKMKQNERREAVSNAQVVYIYHNAIDAVGDKTSTEDQVCDACEQAITEIKNLVRIICNDLSGANIIITADHGFLYSYKPLAESDKIEKEVIVGKAFELDRRYVIADSESSSDVMLKIPLTNLNSNLIGLTPLDNIRLKKQGGGTNYIHGGISLQESVVPVIEYKNMRSSYKKFVDVKNVELQLLTQNRKISNSLFYLDFYQKEPVNGKVTAATYEAFISDVAGKPVSDKKIIIADKTNTNDKERVFRVGFTLKSVDFKKTDTYFLTIVDKATSSIVEQSEFTIEIAFVNDFDF